MNLACSYMPEPVIKSHDIHVSIKDVMSSWLMTPEQVEGRPGPCGWTAACEGKTAESRRETRHSPMGTDRSSPQQVVCSTLVTF